MTPFVLDELRFLGLDQDPVVFPNYNDFVLVSYDDAEEIQGFMIVSYNDYSSSWHISISYVFKNHRRKGVHTKLFEKLVEKAKARGDILSINSGTHCDNYKAQAAFEKQGRKKSFVVYEYKIEGSQRGYKI
uniref:N-acetyltransferase domain-containing protein n=1 Tax=Rhizobium phage LG08 TaxID=3129229 RepID=A0AAU8HXR8_9CAUD